MAHCQVRAFDFDYVNHSQTCPLSRKLASSFAQSCFLQSRGAFSFGNRTPFPAGCQVSSFRRDCCSPPPKPETGPSHDSPTGHYEATALAQNCRCGTPMSLHSNLGSTRISHCPQVRLELQLNHPCPRLTLSLWGGQCPPEAGSTPQNHLGVSHIDPVTDDRPPATDRPILRGEVPPLQAMSRERRTSPAPWAGASALAVRAVTFRHLKSQFS
jgi:hypothetical protein